MKDVSLWHELLIIKFVIWIFLNWVVRKFKICSELFFDDHLSLKWFFQNLGSNLRFQSWVFRSLLLTPPLYYSVLWFIRWSVDMFSVKDAINYIIFDCMLFCSLFTWEYVSGWTPPSEDNSIPQIKKLPEK